MQEKDNLYKIRHSLAHILAMAVLDKYPNAKITLGPPVDNGFYYDIDFGNNKLSPEDFPGLETKMKQIIKEDYDFVMNDISSDDALKMFTGNKYKTELITDLIKNDAKLTTYTTGEFTDLCEGPHVSNTRDIDPECFKLDKVAGSYWRGDEKNAVLTRVYGLAFENKEKLDAYVTQMDEAKKRDHRVLGRELGLFIFSDLVGPGLPLWTPRGTFIRNRVNDFVQELRREYNYQQVTIPHITKKDLYIKSGHWEKYAEDLFKIETRDGHTLCMKPMNCPHHAQIYASQLRSYRELPIRYSETTMVYRDEQSGELNGLSRVLSITQDDAHVFCMESQLEGEIDNIWNLIEKFYTTFGFTKLTPRFSKRDDDAKFKGNIELWVKAEKAIQNLLDKRAPGKWIDGEGEAAFYGPKIDFMAEDALGRRHQVGTIQIDYVQPTNFELEYVNEEGHRDMPVMIHCAIAGSLERFMSVYIEHTAGQFPLWIAPNQIKIIPIKNEMHLAYAENVYRELKAAGIRVDLDDNKNGLGKKVREAKDMKYPYWIVIGDAEIAGNTITLESLAGDKMSLSLDELKNKLSEEINSKK